MKMNSYFVKIFPNKNHKFIRFQFDPLVDLGIPFTEIKLYSETNLEVPFYDVVVELYINITNQVNRTSINIPMPIGITYAYIITTHAVKGVNVFDVDF